MRPARESRSGVLRRHVRYVGSPGDEVADDMGVDAVRYDEIGPRLG